MKKILFLINQLVEKEIPAGFARLVNREIDRQQFEPDFFYSEYPGHCTEMVKSMFEDYDVFVAVGGDGTVNEVAQPLINTGKSMAIIPAGSGNGLARTLDIPLHSGKAVRLINEGRMKTIDTGTINGRPFIHMAGLGFAAEVARCYAQKGNHGLTHYVSHVIRTFLDYKPAEYTIRIDNREYTGSYFLLDFANVSQWGYNAHIAPGADPTDGKLNLAMLSPFPKIMIPVPALRLFLKTMDRCRFMQTELIREANIPRTGESRAHIDGDPVLLEGDIQVRILPASLNVISGRE